ncbi:DEAD/DEAH box helicase [Pseudoalteromonas luteoviolacea]|uniref:DEAD/DEAH box helicase n=1 Tax=Pseudoalteromonas luteoviolacea TaxID=43657 RepID=UPI001B3A3DE7|nr:DEAD/DEAH box helicase [Pseudoalteromonas luteoviolacea]MBQ4877142.1 DEAD/DEAH box helicase [Pseudoalteromonas luteoviolacea]MBQ4906003.1 DEAD/DEAH box helicase [Pseudoalteromonas luteoviolacea]
MHSLNRPLTLTTDTNVIIERLYQNYLALDEDYQTLVQVLAVVFKSASTIKIKQILKRLTEQKVIAQGRPVSALSSELTTLLETKRLAIVEHLNVRINPLIANLATQHAQKLGRLLPILKYAEEFIPVLNAYEWERDPEDENRLTRDFLLLGQLPKAKARLAFHKNPQIVNMQNNSALVQFVFFPFQLDTFAELPEDMQYQAFATLLANQKQFGINNHVALELLIQAQKHCPNNRNLRFLLSETLLLDNHVDQAQQLIKPNDITSYALQLKASFLLLNNQSEHACQQFNSALQAQQKYSKKKAPYLDGVFGWLHLIALLASASSNNDHTQQAMSLASNQLSDKKGSKANYYIGQLFECLSESLLTAAPFISQFVEHERDLQNHPLDYYACQLFSLLAMHWCKQSLNDQHLERLQACRAFFSNATLGLFTDITDQLYTSVTNEHKESGLSLNFATLIKQQSEWDLALDRLLALAPKEALSDDADSTANERLIWLLDITNGKASFQAKVQKRQPNGWSKGKAMPLETLYQNQQDLIYLTASDLAVIDAMSIDKHWQGTTYHLNSVEALRAAALAPNVFTTNDLNEPLDIIESPAQLAITACGEQLLLSLTDLPEDFAKYSTVYAIKHITSHQYVFTYFDKQHLKIAHIIGENGLLIPKQAKPKLIASIAAIAPLLNIASQVSDIEIGLETVEPQAHLIINVSPYQQGLEFHCLSMPFGDLGPAFHPGVGNASISAEIEGKRIATKRNLAQEQELLDSLDAHCPAFLAMADNRLCIADLQDALCALEQLELGLQSSPPLQVKIRWPKGKKVNLSKPLESQHLQLAISKKNQWFDLNGELKINDQQVIELKELLKLVEQSHGRFIELSGQQVVALSHALHEKLVQLNQSTEQGRFHPLASPIVSEAVTGMRMKTLPAWEEQSQKMHQANTLKVTPPADLNATLRDYQHTGFDWAMRLAHWGAGACLADDMGLGKTLQSLAVLLARAKEGPSLIIAPTSVCFNWQQEATKFAPTLSLKLLSHYGAGDARVALFAQLKAQDVVIISYGLLVRDIELLKSINWSCIVADEAQAIKNPLSQRAKAACALKGQFKMITTGTPIENNLVELWSLFRFVNPGLLGNLKRFSERFIQPIESKEDKPIAARYAQQNLKTLLQPFILRRMKHQVLTELPPRTEINVPIQLSDEEHTLYEALRQNAIANIAQANEQQDSGSQHLAMLAELTKLRQVCCNPNLVAPELGLSSAKLNKLDELLQELKENGHKALIFSQFVGHLQLLAQHLKTRDVNYQYLDGSTPAAQRQARVNAFQRGEGEVFLISLKAGGSGLNLTAADYVIHMDPWWNPAVEAQASDRAHRIGQSRPVTIYRLIAQQTIEEKIIAMHEQKRDLAQQLLSGQDTTYKLSVKEVLELLKDTL